MPYGLGENSIIKIVQVFAKYDNVSRVVLYGSRAKGDYKAGSDIDLTIIGEELNLSLLNKISIDLDDLLLPYTFDISIFRQISNSDLIEHIKRVGKVFYKRDTSH